MLKTFLFAAIVANLAVFSVSDSTVATSETEACGSTYSNTMLENYMTCNGYNSTEIEIMTRFSNAYTELTMLCLYNMFRTEPDVNHVTSMDPLFKLLALAAIVETGSSQEETLSVLNMNSKDEVVTAIQILTTIGDKYGRTDCMTMYGDNSYPFSEKFINVAKNITGIETGYVHLNKSAESAATMNACVKNVTGCDENLITEEDLYNNNGANILGNTYFTLYKNIQEIFEDGDNMTFYKTNINGTSETKSVQSTHMIGNITVGTVAEYGATILGIPMVDDCYAKIFYAKNGGNDFANLLFAMRDNDVFHKMMALGEGKCCRVTMPEMSCMNGNKDFVTGMKLAGTCEKLLTLNQTAVCDSVFEGSDSCGYVSNMMHHMDLSIENSCAETTVTDASDCTDVITVDQNFVFCYTCPIGAPQVCAMYLGA